MIGRTNGAFLGFVAAVLMTFLSGRDGSAQKSGYTEETVPSLAAKHAYEQCSADGQPPDQMLDRCQAALLHGLDGRVAAHVHTLIGWSNWAMNRPGAAAEAWRQAAHFEPKDPALQFGIGLFLEAEGKKAEAAAAFRDGARRGLRANSDSLLNLVIGYGHGMLAWENHGHLLDRLAEALGREGLDADAREAAVAACEVYDRAPRKEREALACRRALIPRGEGEAQAHLDLAKALLTEPRYGIDEAIASYREATRLNPLLAQAHLGLAQALEKKNGAENALASYREAARLDPSLAKAKSAIATFERLGFGRVPAAALDVAHLDSAEALADLRRCIDDRRAAACRRAIKMGLSPLQAARAWTFLGMELENADGGGEDSESPAAKAYREAIRGHPDYALAHYRLGLLLLHVAPQEATEALETALRLRPDWDVARESLARLFEYAGKWDRAAKLLERAQESQPGDASSAWQLAQALAQLNRWSEAVPHLQTVSRSRLATATSWVKLGEALEKTSRSAEARTAYQQALQARDGNGPPDYNQRVVWSWALSGVARVGSADDVMAARQRWLATDPGLQPDAITRGLGEGSAWMECRWHRELHVAVAVAYQSQGRQADADKQKEALVAPYRKAIALAPTRPDLHDSLAETLIAIGRTGEALQETREMVRLEPKQPTWQRTLSFRLESAGRLEDALAAETWRAMEPARAEATQRTASILLKLQRDEQALDVLRAGAESADDKGSVIGFLVAALESRGRTAEALPWLRRWFELDMGIRYVYFAPATTRETDLAAATVYRQAAQRDPRDPVPECALGRRLSYGGNTSADESLDAYRRCAAKGSRLAWAQAQLGLALNAAGRHREAIESLEAVERLDPTFFKKRPGFKDALDQSRRSVKQEAAP